MRCSLLARVSKADDLTILPLKMTDIVMAAQHRLSEKITACRAIISIPDHFPVALGYAPWIEEVWVNYLDNALKYGGKEPQIEIGAVSQEEGRVRFWVKDKGNGLLIEDQSQIFVPFSRLHQTDAEGHGLGLSIVQRIVDKLGGTVGVDSEIGHGSEFYFTLPASL